MKKKHKIEHTTHEFSNAGIPCTVKKADHGGVARLYIDCHDTVGGDFMDLLEFVVPVLKKFVDKPTILVFAGVSILGWLEDNELKTYVVDIDPNAAGAE